MSIVALRHTHSLHHHLLIPLIIFKCSIGHRRDCCNKNFEKNRQNSLHQDYCPRVAFGGRPLTCKKGVKIRMSPSIGQEFMRLTRTSIQPEPPQALGVSQPPLELPYDETQPLIALPDPHTVQPVDASLLGLIEQRSSVRRYTTQPLSLAELSYLLWCTQGVKPLKLPDRTLRTVPSAGARHPFETLLLVNRVDGLEPGLYRFIASQHSLIALRLDEPTLPGR